MARPGLPAALWPRSGLLSLIVEGALFALAVEPYAELGAQLQQHQDGEQAKEHPGLVNYFLGHGAGIG